MKKNDNKGFTLIEILVAVIALAIVVLPLLQGFVTTANMNKKSREQMMATSVAQSIMESYTTSTIEDVHQELNPGVPFAVSGSHEYVYSKVDYEHNGSKYDIKITLDASDYQSGTRAFNTEGYTQITSVDTTQDGIYAETDRVLSDAVVEFLDRNQLADDADVIDVTEAQFKTNLKRTIHIVVEDVLDGVGGTDTHTEVNVEFCYEAPENWVDDDEREYSQKLNIYSNHSVEVEKRDETPLRNVYLLFDPYYSSSKSDYFEIHNKANKDFNLYLIKMKPDDVTFLDLYETSYKAYVTMQEYSDSYAGRTKLFTNLGYHLGKVDDESTPEDDRLVGSQVQYIYKSNLGEVTSVPGAPEYFIREYTEERMYKMKVEVYPAGSKATGFLDDDKLAELSN